jgi:hypothetical protein
MHALWFSNEYLGFPFNRNRLGVVKKELEKSLQKRKEKEAKKRAHKTT